MQAREKLTGNKDSKILALFPGSRKNELTRSLCVIEKVIKGVKDDVDAFVIPCADKCKDSVQTIVHKISSEIGNKLLIVSSEEEVKRLAFTGATCALAVSGTVVSELSAYGVPTVVIYDANFITRIVAKRIANVKYVSIPNIILNKKVIPEFLFENCHAQAIIPSLKLLLSESESRDKESGGSRDRVWYPEQSRKLASILPRLCRWGTSENTKLIARPIRPSVVAARTILDLL
uniref:lipid-A-disaccharide synthase n=1 Tax=Aplanochytrium stocchinoi TaxID=215587 RepID=A0A7S3PQ87_9STRA